MDISIMQPYLFPYIGYFQMINCSDYFIIADDVQYIKKGWVNRNRILLNGEPSLITLPVKRGNSLAKINENQFVEKDHPRGRTYFLNKIYNAYHKAPEFEVSYALIEKILNYRNNNVGEYLQNSIREICSYLNIQTEMIMESTFDLLPDMNYQDSVIDVCKRLEATRYINAIGGMNLYSAEKFKAHGIELNFIKTRESITYKQFYHQFVPGLSIIDVMMFNTVTQIKELLTEYDLLNGIN